MTNVNVQSDTRDVAFKTVKVGDWFYSKSGELCMRINGIDAVYGGEFNAVSVANAEEFWFEPESDVILVKSVNITTD